MSLPRFQFNIRHLVELTAFCACAFVLVRQNAVWGIISLLPCFPGFGFDPSIGETSTRGARMLYRSIVLVGFGVIYFTYFCFHPDPAAVWMGIAWMVVYSAIVAAPLWSALYKAIIMGTGYQMPPTDDSCGPIAWRGFGDGPEPRARRRRPLHANEDA